FEHQYTDNVTFNLHVGFGERNGTALGAGSLGESFFHLHHFTYAQIKTALTNDATSGDDATAVANLPSSDPDPSSHTYWVADTEAVALGLLPTSTSIDMFVGFSNTHTFDFDRSDGIAAGAFDFIGTVGHELSEVMGRELGVNENNVNDAPTAHILDLFHYGGV